MHMPSPTLRIWPVPLLLLSLLGSTAWSPSSRAADPWMAPGDLRLRHAVQKIADLHLLPLPATTWPLAWSNLMELPSGATLEGLPDLDHPLAYLRFARDRSVHGEARGEMAILLRTQPVSDSGGSAAGTARAAGEWHVRQGWVGERFALAIATQSVFPTLDLGDLRDTQESFFTGTYLAAALGNWIVGIGAIDRWWGPGWESSLLLSTPVRPSPAVWVQTRNPFGSQPTTAGTTRSLPWTLTLLVSETDPGPGNDAAAPRLLGARGGLLPRPGMEVHLSHVQQTAQPTAVATQTATALDARYGFSPGSYWVDHGPEVPDTLGFYAQYVQQESPSRRDGDWLAGLDWTTRWRGGEQQWFLEYIARGATTGLLPTGQPLPTYFGHDTRGWSLGWMHFFPDGRDLDLSVHTIALPSVVPASGAPPELPAGTAQAAARPDDLWILRLRHAHLWLGGRIQWELELGENGFPDFSPSADPTVYADRWRVTGAWRYRF